MKKKLLNTDVVPAHLTASSNTSSIHLDGKQIVKLKKHLINYQDVFFTTRSRHRLTDLGKHHMDTGYLCRVSAVIYMPVHSIRNVILLYFLKDCSL